MKTVFYEGLYGDNSLELVEQFIHIEPIARRWRYYDWQVKQHAYHKLFQLFYMEEGSGEVLSHESKRPVKGPCFFVIPADTLHGFHFDKDVIGTVFTMPEDRLRSLLKKEPDTMELFSEIYISGLNEHLEHQFIYKLFRMGE